MSKNIYDIVLKDKGEKSRRALIDDLYDIDNEVVEFLTTNSIALNLLFSGRVKGGIPLGHLSMISAPSQLGKSIIGANIIRTAQKKGYTPVLIDTERAFKKGLAKALRIDTDPKALQIFRTSDMFRIEEIVSTIVKDVPMNERKNIVFVLDSWGTLVTTRTKNNSLKGNDVVDMSEPKSKNRLANILLNTGATFFIVNHVYDNTGGFGDPLNIPGGRKVTFNCESVVLGMSRAKDNKNAEKEVTGHFITAKTFKSRFSKGESKLTYRLKYEGGLDPFYGILPDAIKAGVVVQEGQKYRAVNGEKKYFEKNLYCTEFWKDVFSDDIFENYLQDKYIFKEESLAVEEEEFLDSIFE